jgi:hypothetical protein
MNDPTLPPPHVEAVFAVEPHPDPVVRALVSEVEQLRRDNALLRLQLEELGKGLGYGPHPR